MDQDAMTWPSNSGPNETLQRMWSMTPGPSHLSQWGSGSWPPLPRVIPVDGHLCLEHSLLPEILDFKAVLMALGFLNYPKL